MNERQAQALREIGGEELLRLVQEIGEKATERLEGLVEYKALGLPKSY